MRWSRCCSTNFCWRWTPPRWPNGTAIASRCRTSRPESSLDFDRGGDIATGLAQIYREARRLLLTGAKERKPEPVEQARVMIGEIAEAWNQIG
jgi:hypothetical protein